MCTSSRNTFGCFRHFQCALQSFSLISHSVVVLILSDTQRHSATQWVGGRGRNENPRTGTKARFGLSLATFHFGQPIVFLWCVEFNCLSPNTRLERVGVCAGRAICPFLNEKTWASFHSLFSTENHAVRVVQKCYFWLPSVAQAWPWFISWPHSSLSCPPGHRAWLFCNLIFTGTPAPGPLQAAECGSRPAHSPQLLASHSAFSALLTLAAYKVQRSLKSAHNRGRQKRSF